MSTDFPERRRDIRYAARFDVRFARVVDAAKALNAFSVNFSAGGLCVRAREAYAVGERLQVALSIEGVALTLDGVVAWTRGDAVGVRFVDVPDEIRQQLSGIARILARRTT